MYVLALDPSFRNFGYVIFHQEDNDSPFVPIRGRVIRPAIMSAEELKEWNKKHKKTRGKLLKFDHRLTCIMEIIDELKLVSSMTSFDVIIAERLDGSQDAASARAFGIADGVLASLISFMGVPYYRYTNIVIKREFTGSRKASKDDMILEAARRYPDFVEKYFASSTQTETKFENIYEHLADACGVMVTAEQDTTFCKFVGEWYKSKQ